MSLQYKLLQILSSGKTCSGEMLAEQCGVTRAAIWKAVKSLQQQLHLRIDAVRGKGYRLFKQLELLDADTIRNQSEIKAQDVRLDVLFDIDSTNTYLLNHEPVTEQVHAVVSEMQHAGRGRRGRQWVSPFASSLYFSLKWHFNQTPAAMMGLSLAVSVSLMRVLESFGINGLQLKWPNDILYNNQKLCGILIELRGEMASECSVVIGVGLNLYSHEHFEQNIDQPWVSLDQIIEPIPERNTLVGAIIDRLMTDLTQFEQTGLTDFLHDWNRHDKFKDVPVTLISDEKNIMGIARGINEQGALLLEQSGQITPYFSGEVSLRAAT